jgi:polyribonucleotide nucleotidyltransferase
VKAIVAQPEIGDVFNAKVKSIKEFGAFVEFMPGKEGLLHISEIAHERLKSMEGVLQVGQEIQIKIIGVDEKTGKVRLSHKVLIPKPEGANA